VRYKNCLIIWLNYFNRELTRKEGRRIAVNKAIRKPTLNELRDILLSMGYKIIDVRKARYPSSWWVESGYIIIDKDSIASNESKRSILYKIAKEWRRRRGG